MTINEITDKDLREFFSWYKSFHGCSAVAASVMVTCMTGYFKTYSKAADKILARCRSLKLVEVSNGMVTIANNII